jgi:YggT family protein
VGAARLSSRFCGRIATWSEAWPGFRVAAARPWQKAIFTPYRQRRNLAERSRSIMIALISTIHLVISLYSLILLVYVVLSWLTAFNVVNSRHQLVVTIGRITSALVDPVLTPIRKIVPSLGGIDFSPIILIVVLHFLDVFVTEDLLRGI